MPTDLVPTIALVTSVSATGGFSCQPTCVPVCAPSYGPCSPDKICTPDVKPK